MYTIGKFAKKTGLTIRTLRYYDEKNLLKPAYISTAGQRFYNDENILTAQKIATFKYLDYSLDDIFALLQQQTPLLESLQQQKQALMDKQRHLTKIITNLELAIAIHDKATVIDTNVLLLVVHSLMTEAQQRDYLAQYLPEPLIDELYALVEHDFVELNRGYLEVTYYIKQAFAHGCSDAQLAHYAHTLFHLIPAALAEKIARAFEETALEEIDLWLFPSPFTAQEEQWFLAQVDRLQQLEGEG